MQRRTCVKKIQCIIWVRILTHIRVKLIVKTGKSSFVIKCMCQREKAYKILCLQDIMKSNISKSKNCH